MDVAIITGSAGLIGSESARHFAACGMQVVGVDNDMRKTFFGEDASTSWNVQVLNEQLGPASYIHHNIDIRDRIVIDQLFAQYGKRVKLVVHCAAQPSHDWAAREPFTDFDVNAGGTLSMLEAMRAHSPEAVFIFTSTNKVYGDTPNLLPLTEMTTRWEIDSSHRFVDGITEEMSIDCSMHSIFGASKVSADIMVQEYGRYFGLKTAVFRGGTLTGPQHSATELHGFLGYLMKCAMSRTPYTVFGYQAKQVRDAIHSQDLVNAFELVYHNPRCGEVYNIGGGRFSHCSMIEGIQLCESITGNEMDWTYADENRSGDHIWYVGSNAKFKSHYPSWEQRYDVPTILQEMYESNVARWS